MYLGKYKGKPPIAVYNGLGGLEIKEIEHGIEDYVIYWQVYGNKMHRSKVRYGKRPYFMFGTFRIYLDECILIPVVPEIRLQGGNAGAGEGI